MHASDSLSVLHGAHSLKFGGGVCRVITSIPEARGTSAAPSPLTVRERIDTGTPANALSNVLADLLLGFLTRRRLRSGSLAEDTAIRPGLCLRKMPGVSRGGSRSITESATNIAPLGRK